MSHSLSKVNIGNNAVVICKIINYVAGGESFTLVELGLTALVDVLFILSQDQQALSMPITPRLVGSVVQLGTPTGNSAWGEIPTTSNLNFVFVAVVQGTN